MRRREFIVGLGGAAAAWPVLANAQQTSRVPRVGILLPGSADSHGAYLAVFMQRIRELGYVEGRNINVDIRWAEGSLERLSLLANELVERSVDAIVTGSAPATVAARQATSRIPIVQAGGGDPTRSGTADSLARPGGNVTGLSNQTEDLGAKLLELLLLVVPAVSQVDVLINPNNPVTERQFANIQEASAVLRVVVRAIAASDTASLDDAFVKVSRSEARGLIVPSDPMYLSSSRRIVALVGKTRLPAIYPFRQFVIDGGLMSYGVDLRYNFRRAAAFVDRILKGTQAADLPIEQPTKFDLVINLKTAKAFGLEISPTLLARADEVIE